MEVMTQCSVAQLCSYECLFDFTLKFLTWLREMNIIIEQFFYDGLSDMDKVMTYKTRRRERLKRIQKLRDIVDGQYDKSTPHNLVEGLPHIRMCSFSIRAAVLAFFKNNKSRVRQLGTDPDRLLLRFSLMYREIAKYAHDHNCYVLTGDYDFAVFPTRGMICVQSLIHRFSRGASMRTIPIMPHSKLRTELGLTDERLLYVAVLRGNDFVGHRVPSCAVDCPSEEALERIIEHVRSVRSNEEDMIRDCLMQFPRLSEDAVRWRFEMVKRKYDVNSYPSFPLSFLTEEEDEGVYDECGVTRGLGVSLCCDIDSLTDFITSYGAHYSHFLLDCIFSCVLYIPVTLFFTNKESSVV